MTNKREQIDRITNSLPHGSGINGDWNIEENDKRIKASNYYEPMNEVGFYDGIAYFTLYIPINEPDKFTLHFNDKRSQYYNRKYSLRDYLEDTIVDSIRTNS
jgi:hypothetical protein